MNQSVLVNKLALVVIIAGLPALACAPGPGPPLAELQAGVAEAPLAFASSARVPVEWQPLGAPDPPDSSPFLFVHLVDGDGKLVRTFDREMPADAARFEHLEIWQSALATPLPAGTYRLISGLYDVASGRRWRLETSAAEIDDGKYEIAAIEVPSSERQTPELIFDGDWLPPEDGQLHNPGRRWLGKGGEIRLRGSAGWGELVLGVSMTALPADRHRLVMDDADQPQLVVRNGCAGVDGGQGSGGGGDAESTGDETPETRITGFGMHSFSLRLGAADDCAITLEPNFGMLDLEDFTNRSVGLESAFFRPKG